MTQLRIARATWRERLQYRFDNWMSRGTGALMALLAIATGVFVVILGGVTAIVLAVAPDPHNPYTDDYTAWDVLWGSLMRTLDPGTMGGDQGWYFRILMLLVTIGGLVIVASLIGIVSGAFDDKVAELRQGRSRVLESDHTLILGWSEKVFSIVSELAIANESRGRSAIVVLADRDKVEMEQAIADQAGAALKAAKGTTTVICRRGDPMSLHDLDLGSPRSARSIVLLAGDGDDDPDATVIKTALALTNNPHRRPEPYHIVGELQDPSNLEAARLVGRDEAHWVLATDLISRVTVQTCRQSGLSVVYTELLDYGGDEMYFSEQPALVGRSYADAQLAFADSTLMGLVRDGAVLLNPTPTTLVESGDQLVVIAEDDDAIELATPGTPDPSAFAPLVEFTRTPEHTLVLGAHDGLALLLGELDQYVEPGSTARIVADSKEPKLPPFENLAVTFQRADPTSRRVLDALEAPGSDHIIVLADKERLAPQRADARTLVTLLHLRDIAETHDVDLNVVSEMLDDRNRELAEVTDADDFIVSEKLVSLMLTQVSENRMLANVFATLFSSEGSEIYLRPAELYVPDGREVDFYTVAASAQRRGETALGYRIHADRRDADAAYGVHVNPHKPDRVRFALGDRVIVLAED